MKNKLDLIQISLEEKLNDMHKSIGETLNSRQILNDFLFKMNLEFEELKKALEEEYK
jgi:hypothetical protein